MSDSDIAISPESETASTLSAMGARGFREFLRYFVASAIALVVDAGSLWVMTSVFGIPYLISGAVAFMLGIAIVYILSVKWVFEARSMRNPAAEFGIFLVIGVIGLFINELVLWALTGGFGLYYLFSKGASVIIVFSWNFFARKWLLFRSGKG